MPNTNPHTGIRYGVISFNALADWCNEDLFYGQHAQDLSHQQALQDIKAEVTAEVRQEVEDGLHSSADEPDFDFEAEVERRVEQAVQNLDISEPHIAGELDGVKYEISWLGGAPLVWVFEGPLGLAQRLCSPCCPNAADLDSGFVLEGEATPEQQDQDYLCYVVPKAWLREEV